MWKIFAIFGLISSVCVLQIHASLGNCPKLQGMSDFNPNENVGRWYEFARSKDISKMLRSCSYFDISLQAEGLYNMVYTYYSLNNRNAETWLSSIKNSDMPKSKEAKSPLMLDTDYENYAILYYCDEQFLGARHTDTVFILTRQGRPNEEIIDQIYDVLHQASIDKNSLNEVNQRDCPRLY